MSRCKVITAASAVVVALTGCVAPMEPVTQPVTVAPRGDNPNLPNPVTPSGANESASQPQGSLRDPTNTTGMPRGGAAR